jgi:hypothetical protein
VDLFSGQLVFSKIYVAAIAAAIAIASGISHTEEIG